jgi:hypothetical protein
MTDEPATEPVEGTEPARSATRPVPLPQDDESYTRRPADHAFDDFDIVGEDDDYPVIDTVQALENRKPER